MDASPVADHASARSADAVESELLARGAIVDRAVLRNLTIRPCTGCFGCWTKRPGECLIDDDARGLAAKTIASDLMVIATPVRFGTWGSLAKSALDRMIGLILPTFASVNGEIHHHARYPRYPKLLAVGTTRQPRPEVTRLFEQLVTGNAVNLHIPAHAVVLLGESEDPRHAVGGALEQLGVQA